MQSFLFFASYRYHSEINIPPLAHFFYFFFLHVSMQGYTVHPKYQTNAKDEAYNDIALLRLSGTSKQRYVNLSKTPPPKGQLLTAIGWGATPKPENNDGISEFSSEILL